MKKTDEKDVVEVGESNEEEEEDDMAINKYRHI
jgi:hypothetical protein